MQGKGKLERTRELFEQAAEHCPAKFAKPIFLLYATFEEASIDVDVIASIDVLQDHGLARHAMAVYERAAQKVEKSEKLGVWQLYIKRASSIFGVPHTRELFEKAIESLQDKDAYVMCMQFADVERKVPQPSRL